MFMALIICLPIGSLVTSAWFMPAPWVHLWGWRGISIRCQSVRHKISALFASDLVNLEFGECCSDLRPLKTYGLVAQLYEWDFPLPHQIVHHPRRGQPKTRTQFLLVHPVGSSGYVVRQFSFFCRAGLARIRCQLGPCKRRNFEPDIGENLPMKRTDARP